MDNKDFTHPIYNKDSKMLRCLSDPTIQLANFYGLLCFDCVIGYFPLQEDQYLVADQESTREVDYLSSDTEDSCSNSAINVNPAYQPQKRIGLSICNDEHIPYSNSGISTPTNEEAIVTDVDNETLNDPDLSYYRHFDTLDHCISSTTSNCHLSTLDSDRQTLLSGDEEGIKIRKCLRRYQYSIRSVNDLNVKKQLVEEYETFKSKYDADNHDDAEKAKYYLIDARNEENQNHSDKKRIEFYQKAIAFTNDPEQKKVIRNEYRDFCYNIQRKKGTNSRQQTQEQSV